MSDIERFGRDMGDFLRGFLSTPSHTATSDPGSGYGPGDPGEQPASHFPRDFELWADFNQAHKLKPGNLLAVHLRTNRVFQVDIHTGDIVFMFSLNWGPRTYVWKTVVDDEGSIYCSVSGSLSTKDGRVPPGYRTPVAKFGYWGAVVKVNHRRGELRVLAETKVPGVGPVLDPHGLQLLRNERKLLVCDYQGFGGGGAIYKLDVSTGALEMVVEQGLLNETPVSAFQDTDGTLWVANTDMANDDGEIIKIDPHARTQQVFLKREGRNSGGVCGVLPTADEKKLVIFRLDWPNVGGKSAVSLVDKESGMVEELFGSTVDDPRFYNTNGDVDGDVLWFGECVRKEIVGYDLRKRQVVKTIDFRPAAGGWSGMIDSYDSIETVTVIPHSIRQ